MVLLVLKTTGNKTIYIPTRTRQALTFASILYDIKKRSYECRGKHYLNHLQNSKYLVIYCFKFINHDENHILVFILSHTTSSW